MESPSKEDIITTSPRVLFGRAVREARLAAGLSQKKLAPKIPLVVSALSMIENGVRWPSPEVAKRLDGILGTSLMKLRERLEQEHAMIPGWFRPWVEIEQEADTLRGWHPLMVPGLLQTADYARAILWSRPGATTGSVEKALEARMKRQVILKRERPPLLWVVLDEGILLKPVGSRDMMVAQMGHLLETAKHPNVTIQVLPYAAHSMAGLMGGFVLAQQPGKPDTVYLQTAVRGQVLEAPTDVKIASMWYEAIRADSLSQRESLVLIEKRMQSWT